MADVRYYLPESRVMLSGIVEQVTTTFGQQPQVAIHPLSTGVAWQTCADQQASATLDVDAGLLEDRVAALTFSADRRLASLSSSSAGKLDGFVKAALKTAVSLAVVVGGRPLSETAEPPTFTTAADGYDHSRPEDSKRLAQLRAQLVRARSTLVAKRAVLLDQDPGDPVDDTHLREIRALSAMTDQIEADVDQAAAAFEAWKQTHTTARTEQLEALLELRQLPFWKDGTLDWESTSPPTAGELGARDVWDRLGFVLARLSPSRTPQLAEPDGGGVLVRIPRLISLALVRRDASNPDGPSDVPDDAPGNVEEILHRWVMDDRCDTEFLPLARRLAGNREISLGFDDSGALVSLSKSSKSGAADLIGGVTGGLTDGLASAKSTMDTLDGFRSHAEAARKARLDLQLATAKAEVELAGIAATRAEQAKVAALAKATGADLGG